MDWLRERKDIIILNNIRKQIRSQYYGKIEIWRLFGANITLKIWDNWAKPKSTFYWFQNLFVFIYLFFIRDLLKHTKVSKNELKPKLNNPFVIEVISDEKRTNGLWLPVAKKFPANELLLVTAKKDIYNKYKSDFNIQLVNNFNFSNWILSRIQIIKFILHNCNILFFNKSFRFPLSGFDIINVFIVQVNYIISFQWLVKKYNPSGFLTIWDWYDIGSAGTAVFKSKNLPTFTFIHGACGKEALKEMVPINADYILSWGRMNTKALLELDVVNKSILECGCPRILSQPEFDKHTVKSNATILIILTAIIDNCFVKDIANIVDNYSTSYLIKIRLHPSTAKEDLQPELRELQHVQFITTFDETIEQSINDSDIIITDTSSAAFDVVNLNKPLFIIDSAPIPRPQDIANEIVCHNAAIFCRTFREFTDHMKVYLSNIQLREKLSAGRKSFINEFIVANGESAATKIFENISQITK